MPACLALSGRCLNIDEDKGKALIIVLKSEAVGTRISYQKGCLHVQGMALTAGMAQALALHATIVNLGLQ